MKMALYAFGDPRRLKVMPTLNIEVDRWWWGNEIERQAGSSGGKVAFFVPISTGMPLQWAVRLAGSELQGEAVRWSRGDWERWLRQKLASALEREEPSEIGNLLGLNEGEGVVEWEAAGVVEQKGTGIADRAGGLGEKANGLAALLEGRSLLRGEIEALLSERAPEIAEDWKSAAQLAYLQGKVRLRGGVGLPDGPWPGSKGKSSAGRGRIARLLGPWGTMTAVRPVCVRCGSAASNGRCAVCGSADCARCEACRALGRSRSCELLVQGTPRFARGVRPAASAEPLPKRRASLARWKLSPAQTAAAELALRFLEREPQRSAPDSRRQQKQGERRGGSAPWVAEDKPLPLGAANGRDTSAWAAGDPASRFLLWAVTGAGKTEMLFPLIESIRRRGGRVVVATPRRDVVLELAPRLRRAFPGEDIAALYGGSEERWRCSGVVLATTHQLLRFAQAFDLVVIDELDAFPFHGDPMLAYAAEVARAPGGRTVYLSATPPRELQRLVRAGRVACARVPVRYHRHPLPMPELLRTPPVADFVRAGKLPPALLRRWRTSLARGAQVFVFVPKIALAEPLAALLRRAFKGVPVGATSSRDEDRAGKVLSFRSAELRMLVTTTILERGVTVPRSDVYVLDADSGLFDEASLVQMAGRAGRSADDPAGAVVFAAAQKTRAQSGARRQIRRMNVLAKPYLLPEAARSFRFPRSLLFGENPGSAKRDHKRARR